jgi:hypothetical protein
VDRRARATANEPHTRTLLINNLELGAGIEDACAGSKLWDNYAMIEGRTQSCQIKQSRHLGRSGRRRVVMRQQRKRVRGDE